MREPIRLAVVGHTNVGKTSLLRTLLRDRQFGEVSHRPSTTRHVEGARLSANGRALLELYDTPGMEDAIALLELLDRQAAQAPRQDGPTRISRFLDSSEARQRFEQEAKVLRQLLSADAGLYVIDAREPVLAKYRDELAILALCGKPLLPVLNFSAVDTPRQLAWRQALARLGLHALVCFDSVTPPADGEQRLYQSLTLLLEKAREPLQVLLDDLRLQQQQRQQAGLRLIAELLLDCAALRRRAASQETERVLQQLQDSVRQREQRIGKAQQIGVEVRNPQVISEAPDSAIVTFRQRYSADSYADMSEKTLEWRKEGGQWRIVREQVRTIAQGQ